MNEENNNQAVVASPPSNNETFISPYEHLSGKYTPGVHGRIQCDIGIEDYRKFYHILPARQDAVFQRTFGIITKKLLEALEKAGIKSYEDGDDYKEFIMNLRIEDGRGRKKGSSRKEKKEVQS